MCCVVFRFMKATEHEIMNPIWLCHEHIVCEASHLCVGIYVPLWDWQRERAFVSVYVFGCDILLLSSLPGSARGRAVGHRHHFGHVGLSTGLLSYRQHSLHCRYGKELTYSKHLHSITKIWLKNSSKSHSSLSDIFRT